jgi:hypothetical protein
VQPADQVATSLVIYGQNHIENYAHLDNYASFYIVDNLGNPINNAQLAGTLPSSGMTVSHIANNEYRVL